MKLFEAMASISFKENVSGRTVWYPWGIFGKGYILPDKETEIRIRRFLTRYYMTSLPVIIVSGTFLHWLFVSFIITILIIWHYFMAKSLVASRKMASHKLTVQESLINTARSFNIYALLFLLIISILFLVASFNLMIVGSSTPDKMTGAFGVLFSFICAFVHGYLIKLKRT